MSLENHSILELERELARRRPDVLKEINTSRLLLLCKRYLDEVASGKSELWDLREYMFEAAMEAVYGENVWDWISATAEKH